MPPESDPAVREVDIFKEPVELYKILKFEGIVANGGEAKSVIENGLVSVNGEMETRKRKKIFSGDVVAFEKETLKMRLSVPG